MTWPTVAQFLPDHSSSVQMIQGAMHASWKNFLEEEDHYEDGKGIFSPGVLVGFNFMEIPVIL